MTLLIPAKVLLHVWSNDFYDMKLSTGKERRHMINVCKIPPAKEDFIQNSKHIFLLSE